MKETFEHNIDKSVNPRDDFYSYACGGWMQKNPLKDEYSRYGVFDEIREKARLQLKELITTLSESPEAKLKGSVAQKVADLYAMGMDEERLNREGGAPLTPVITRIEALDVKDEARNFAWLHSQITTTLFGSGVGPGYEDSNMNVLHITETGLGLGDRDYYLEDNEANKKIMEAYKEYIVKTMRLAGYSDDEAERIKDTVIKIETEIARHKMTREQRRNPNLHNNMTTVEELAERYPGFDWKVYFVNLELDVKEVNVINPSYMEFIIPYIKTLTEEELKHFWVYEFISESTGLLSDDFGDVSFELFGRVMSGAKERKPRWKRAMALPDSMLGEAVGELYVKKYFPESHKKAMSAIVENLRVALGKHIQALSWMSETTKTKALEKLDKMGVKIGYPDKFKDYSEIEIDPEKSYMENVLRASRWYVRDNYNKLGKEVDKEEWHMTPQTVNAYYSPLNNEICFPAAILQPPYFDINADKSDNYGAIGVVIGHEMTHAFDDQGRQFDVDGNLSNWWEESDAESFNKLADKLVEQFSKVEVADGVYANGRYTLGENIADQGGLRIAFTAYKEALAMENVDKEDARKFYIAYAGVWAENIRPEEILSRNVSDPHSLGRNRVNETLKNINEFQDAFEIKEGDGMYRSDEERVIIW